jgi:NDP-hexose 4-ketoreductase
VEIVGAGFVARGLRSIADKHADVLAFAAGPSRTSATTAECDREATLLKEVIAGCRRSGAVLLYFSTASSAMYPDDSRPGREDEPVTPRRAYGGHKREMEIALAASGCRHLILRLSHLIGPEQPRHQLVPTLVDQIRSGSVTIFAGARRDFLDLSHMVEMVDGLLSAGVTEEVVNVASGYSVAVSDVVDHLERRMGGTAVRKVVPGGDAHWVSIEKLTRLVPEAATLGFGPLYYRTTVDRYVAAVHA